MIPIPTKGLGDLAERLFVSIPRERVLSKLHTINAQIEFALARSLILPGEESELAEILLNGGTLYAAIAELRMRRP